LLILILGSFTQLVNGYTPAPESYTSKDNPKKAPLFQKATNNHNSSPKLIQKKKAEGEFSLYYDSPCGSGSSVHYIDSESECHKVSHSR